MPKRSTSFLILLIGLILTCSSLLALYLGDVQLSGGKSFTLTTPEGDQLNGTYYPGKSSAAVLLLEGFGSDQVAMRSLANEFNLAGFHVFSFDFSGQGLSSGGLSFDYAQTDRLANQVLLVEKNIPLISGQTNLPLILIGNGLGGRVALQSAVLDSHLIQGLVLIGPQVNLAANQQAEFFTDTKDTSLPWIQLLKGTVPNTKILFLSGTLDDILTLDSGSLLLQSLTDDRKALPGSVITSSILPSSSREWLLFPDRVHNFEIYDSHIIAASLAWSQDILKVNPVAVISPVAEARGWLWILGITGIFISGEGARRAIRHRIHHHHPNLHGVEIANLRRFILSKVLLWLAAVPFIGIVAGLMLIIPLPKPVFNLYYVGFIGGYGLLMLLLYRFGLHPGVYGKLKFSMILKELAWRRVIITLVFNLAMLAILTLYANSGWYGAPPGGLRLVWALIFVPFTALGFWFGHLEIDLIEKKYPDDQIAPVLATLNVLLPFFIYNIVMAFLGSTSGVISGLQGLLILALVLLQGAITYRLTGYRWLTAILQALMLYLLILPTGALFNL